MKIEISGSRCITCDRYTQYFRKHYWEREYVAIDCGYCGRKCRNVRPGDYCKDYSEASNVLSAVPEGVHA